MRLLLGSSPKWSCSSWFPFKTNQKEAPKKETDPVLPCSLGAFPCMAGTTLSVVSMPWKLTAALVTGRESGGASFSTSSSGLHLGMAQMKKKTKNAGASPFHLPGQPILDTHFPLCDLHPFDRSTQCPSAKRLFAVALCSRLILSLGSLPFLCVLNHQLSAPGTPSEADPQ